MLAYRLPNRRRTFSCERTLVEKLGTFYFFSLVDHLASRDNSVPCSCKRPRSMPPASAQVLYPGVNGGDQIPNVILKAGAEAAG